MIIFSSRRTYHSILWQHDDTCVIIADTNLVFSAYHAITFNTTQFRLLDDEFLIAVIEHTAQISYDYLLTSSHIWCATYYLRRLALA